jgi:hypothetical protein
MEPRPGKTGRKGHQGVRALAVLATLSILVLAAAANPRAIEAQSIAAGSSPSIVQFASGYTSGGSDTSVSATFQEPIKAGDSVVICASIINSEGVAIRAALPLDSMNTNYLPIDAQSSSSGDAAYAGIFIGKVARTGADSVHLSYSEGPATLLAYEISGERVSQNQVLASSGADQGTPMDGAQVAPYSPVTGSLVIACGGFVTLDDSGLVRAGAGYTLDQSFNGNDAGEHLAGFTGGNTSSPFGFSQPVATWAEVSAGFTAGAPATSSTLSSTSSTLTNFTTTQTVTATMTVTSIVTPSATSNSSTSSTSSSSPPSSSSSSSTAPTNQTTQANGSTASVTASPTQAAQLVSNSSGTLSETGSVSEAAVSPGSNASASALSVGSSSINLPVLGAVATIALVAAGVVVLWVRRL